MPVNTPDIVRIRKVKSLRRKKIPYRSIALILDPKRPKPYNTRQLVRWANYPKGYAVDKKR